MWSLDEYCQKELLRQSQEDWSQLPETSRHFLQALQLPTIHPFCQATKLDDFYMEGIPPMGPLLQEDYHHHFGDVIVTQLYRVLPALLAMGELWLRLFASAIAPLGILYMILQEAPNRKKNDPSKPSNAFSVIVVLTVASSVVLMTDTFYVLEYGPQYGLMFFLMSSMMALRACSTHQLSKTIRCLVLLKFLTGYLLYHPSNNNSNRPLKLSFGDPVDAVTNVKEGLYYNPQNEFIANIVDAWPVNDRTYSKDTNKTPWMPTGDSRTGLPFLLNKVGTKPIYHRLWLETHDEEYVALDISIPHAGHSVEKPLYLVSEEEYCFFGFGMYFSFAN
jgi:hypothetical protein